MKVRNLLGRWGGGRDRTSIRTLHRFRNERGQEVGTGSLALWCGGQGRIFTKASSLAWPQP